MLKKLHVNSENSESVSLWFLFWNFFKIGSTAFGGFMALISVVENRMVRRHKLLTHEDMLDGISLATVLPGPVAANVVAYVGYRLGRTNGAVVSAIGVLLPSFILVIGLTIAYLQAGEIPALQKAFAGFIPAVVAIILSAARRMSKKAIKGWREVVIAIIAAVLLKVVGGFYITVLVVFGSGLVGWLWLGDTKHSGQENSQAQPIQESIQGISWLKLSVTLLILLSFPL
ncbi:MAG: chromate transporter, partial [Moorea sp. SIO4A1]|uniref:chromate transporter n=1 Tax=Moorena sp. SIO4A1 TaxID=2607835 RepID=UPI00144EBDD4